MTLFSVEGLPPLISLPSFSALCCVCPRYLKPLQGINHTSRNAILSSEHLEEFHLQTGRESTYTISNGFPPVPFKTQTTTLPIKSRVVRYDSVNILGESCNQNKERRERKYQKGKLIEKPNIRHAIQPPFVSTSCLSLLLFHKF